MNNTTYSFIEFTFGAILVLTTLAYTFWSMTLWPDRFDIVPSAATVFVEQTEIPHEVSWTGAQVVAKLYQLDTEETQGLIIEVDGFQFETEDDVKLNSYKVHLSSDYTQKVVLDEKGLVTRIIFKKGV